MDRQIILSKVASLKKCIDRIIEKRTDSIDVLKDDLDRQDIIVVNLERAIQVCVDLSAMIVAEKDEPAPLSMSEGFETLLKMGIIDEALSVRMKKAVAFRNIAVHQYQKINWEIVMAITQNHLVDFQNFAKQIMKWVEAISKNKQI